MARPRYAFTPLIHDSYDAGRDVATYVCIVHGAYMNSTPCKRRIVCSLPTRIQVETMSEEKLCEDCGANMDRLIDVIRPETKIEGASLSREKQNLAMWPTLCQPDREVNPG